jgi:hypothetical protein
VPGIFTIILVIAASISLIGIFTTAVPDFTSSLRLQVTGIGYDATEATEKFKELTARFSALVGKDLRDPEDYGKLAKDNFEDPMNNLLDKTTEFSDIKVYPIIYIIALGMIILGIYYLPACLSVFCGLLAILQIAAFVVILVLGVISTDVADIKYGPIIRKSAEGDENFTKIVNFYLDGGPFLIDFDENLQAKILREFPAEKIVEELVNLKEKKGGKVPTAADISDDDLNKLPQTVKDKLNDYDGNDEDVNELKDRLEKLGPLSAFMKPSKNSNRGELADAPIPLTSPSSSPPGSSRTEIDMTKVTTWYAEWLQTNILENLKEDVEKNYPNSYKKFEAITSATAPEKIAAAMNADDKLKNAYVYPYSILKSVRMFQRNYLHENMTTLTTSIEKNLVTPLNHAFICLFCLWLLTALLMIAVIARNCSGKEETEKETSVEIAV